MQGATPTARQDTVRSDLVAAQARLCGVLDHVGPEDWGRRGQNEGWTVHSLLIHLATAEAGFVSLLRRMATGGGGASPDFDPDRWNAGQLRRRGEAPPHELRAELEAAHAQMLELLAGLDQAALDQRGHLSSGEDGTLEDGFRLVARHKRGHTRDIETALALRPSAGSG